MEVLPIDIVALASVIMGISIVLIPVVGLTARYALKPFVSVVERYLRSRDSEESVQIVERRMALLEQQLDDVQGSLRRLVEVSEFDARLRAGSDLQEDPARIQGPGHAEPQQDSGEGEGQGAV